MSVKPLKFTDPVIERQTYVAAMSKTIIDKTDGDMTVDKAVDILWRYGYDKLSIARYVNDANQHAKEQTEKWQLARPISSRQPLSI